MMLNYPMEKQTRNHAEWFDVGPVVKKRVGNLSFEVWANGRFCIRAPNDDYFKSDTRSAESWLIEHGINNDEELSKAKNDEDGWELINNRWYELIVFEEKENGIFNEVWSGSDVVFEYDKESFQEWIDIDIKDWKEDPPAWFQFSLE